MSNLVVEQDQYGYPLLRFEDHQYPKERASLEASPWRCYGLNDQEERVLLFVATDCVLYLSQSDIAELLPYLQRFAKTGKLLPGQAR